MLALDTNVLVRLLIDDPDAGKQCAAARKVAGAAGSVSICQVVQIETVWVLEGVYGFGRAALADALDALNNNQSYVLQHADVFRAALDAFRASTADFADCVMLTQARSENLELATFDRKLGKLAGTRLLSG